MLLISFPDNIRRNAVNMANKPLSEEAEKAVKAAKQDEANHTNQYIYQMV